MSLQPTSPPAFLAFDFETANVSSNSACAIGLVRVEAGQIVRQEAHLIRPPSPHFQFSYIHGITWEQVKSAPTFGELWPRLKPFFEGVSFVAAHNASFDARVLRGLCQHYALEMPDVHFECTVQLARQAWNLYPTKLPDVCRHLGLTLNHHEALSDAVACAKIVLATQSAGVKFAESTARLL